MINPQIGDIIECNLVDNPAVTQVWEVSSRINGRVSLTQLFTTFSQTYDASIVQLESIMTSMGK